MPHLICTTLGFLFAILICLEAIPEYKLTKDLTNCGYQSCHPVKEGFINVHIVPHTHDDVGWLKTINQYYYGLFSNIQKAGVEDIIDSVISALRRNKNRKFIYVETAFFWQWWQKQNDDIKNITRTLVDTGQLEFVGGGWSMNDEGTTHYHSIIDQMSWGLKKLNDTFGECGRPKVGWQIDPFGHSKGMAHIFALLGYDAFLLNRIDYQEMKFRVDNDTLEMIWRSSSNLGEESNIFTSILPRHYDAPDGFCFDMFCNEEPIIDNPRSPDNNVNAKTFRFISFLGNNYYGLNTKNILITMGQDFSYQEAESWFKNLDKLIKYTNMRQVNGSQYNLLYSTPSCYIKAVYDESNKEKMRWPVKQDDFMPYADRIDSYWTGYYTSRPTLKRYEREGNNFLQICKQLSVLTEVELSGLDKLREAMGVLQHHDAVSGTEKQHVADDYARILSQGMHSCEEIVSSALSTVSIRDEYKNIIKKERFINCPLLNISQCAFTENNENFVVTIYNPLSKFVTKFVRLPVTGDNYSVKNSQGQELVIQIQPVNEPLLKVPGRNSSAVNELIFAAIDVPPLGFESFFVEKQSGNAVLQPILKTSKEILRDFGFAVDPSTGFLTRIFGNGLEIAFSQFFAYYRGFVLGPRQSGAYIFRPDSNFSTLVSYSANYKVYSGPVVSELHQEFNEYVSQVVRVYPCENYVEFQWLVGPLPDEEGKGKEVISVFKTQLNNNGSFYTDSNGRELLKRTRNSRPTYNVNIKELVSANYYPVTSKIVIKDDEKNIELGVLTDRSQGGSSTEDGEIELMVHRRCLQDDGFGVGETLMEMAYGQNLVARGTHYVVVGKIQNSDGPTAAALQRDIAQRKLLDAWIFLSSTEDLSFEEYKMSHRLHYNGLNRALPDNVQILTLEPWKDDEFLLRLEHVFEKNEDIILSHSVVVDLENLFATFEIISIKETTLGGNQWLEDNDRLIFNEGEPLENTINKNKVFENKIEYVEETESQDDLESLKIELNPMEIRTFIIKMKTPAS